MAIYVLKWHCFTWMMVPESLLGGHPFKTGTCFCRVPGMLCMLRYRPFYMAFARTETEAKKCLYQPISIPGTRKPTKFFSGCLVKQPVCKDFESSN